MPEGPDGKTIIIVKKVSGHGGHHGGAWKVAFADFVTAMMALFMVLWLVNSASVTTREKIASFFRRPGVFEKGSGTPLELGGAGILPDAFAPPVEGNARIAPSAKTYTVSNTEGENLEGFGRGEGTNEGDAGPGEQQGISLETIAMNIEKSIQEAIYTEGGFGEDYFGQNLGDGESLGGDKSAVGKEETEQGGDLIFQTRGDKDAGEGADTSGAFLKGGTPGTGEGKKDGEAEAQKNQGEQVGKLNPLGEIDVFIDQRGLHIEIMDTEKTSMFELGSPAIRGEAADALAKIAAMLKNVPNPIDIEGHTDARPFSPSMSNTYDNWNLSADRANSARRILEKAGVKSSQIARIVGYADQRPKLVGDPMDASNRRITITMRYSEEAAQLLGGKARKTDPRQQELKATTATEEPAQPQPNEAGAIVESSTAGSVISQGKEGNLEVEVGTHLPEGERMDPAQFDPPEPIKKEMIFGEGGTMFGG